MSDKVTKVAKKKKDLSSYTGILSSLISIVAGMIVALIILMIANPSTGLGGFGALLTGGISYGGIKNIGDMLYFATPILCTGVAMCLAFQAGVFNIGGPGQYYVGAFAAVFTAIKLDGKLTGIFGWLVPILASMVAGALWALIPGILKAYFNVNVVISTTMFNYIATYYVVYWVRTYIYDKLRGQSQAVPSVSKLPQGFLYDLTDGGSVDLGFFIAVLAAFIVWVLLEKTTTGYELKACGMNADASRYAGIQAKRNIMLSIVISGALCGLGGGLHYLSNTGLYIKVVETTPAEGFTGIAVCCLASNNPLGAIFGAIYMAYLTVGGQYMQLFGFQKEIVSVITGVVIYFSAFSSFIQQKINLAIAKRSLKKAKQEGEKS